MSNERIIIWTPEQRKSVVEFLKLYANKLEEQMYSEEDGYGLPMAQSGALHIVDKLIPSGTEYVVNHGPKLPLLEDVRVILSTKEYEVLDRERFS